MNRDFMGPDLYRRRFAFWHGNKSFDYSIDRDERLAFLYGDVERRKYDQAEDVERWRRLGR